MLYTISPGLSKYCYSKSKSTKVYFLLCGHMHVHSYYTYGYSCSYSAIMMGILLLHILYFVLVRKQEKSNNEKRLRDAFSLMNDILTSKPSLHHKPSYNTANHDGMLC